MELLEHLVAKKQDSNLPILTQVTRAYTFNLCFFNPFIQKFKVLIFLNATSGFQFVITILFNLIM